ncbi:MAG: PRC-barrel domain-containing protein [Acetobacteraceae bacterium]
MLWRSSTLIGYGIRATDGALGSIVDLLIDDQDWTVRWAVVDTGNWFPGRRVLLPAHVLGEPDSAVREFPVDLTRQQVNDSPDTATDQPVSRQMEVDLYSHYGWAPYWGAGSLAYPGYLPTGPAVIPPAGGVPDPRLGARAPDGAAEVSDAERGDPHLRSATEVTGYYVHATDQHIGHVEEFLIDSATWQVRYVVVDTKNWWPGRKVMVSTRWFRDIDWGEREVHVDLTREQVRSSPEFDQAAPIERDYEERLHGHYGQRIPWI